ncbi:MAG: DNA gyrase subunit A, partial [Armatimonadetes bacterium]|nr:DNA gyrase subunit A [Anaerolineae bacterium]
MASDNGTIIQQVNIEQEMRESYLDYAMSVIVARALPDARDGLKPVHRRILFAMHDMGIRAGTPYKKSARIVGEVLGKYHPHGDSAVYESMVRMAQDFAMRYMLVDGQGNYGSIDGDSAAAMRYTEARIAAIGSELLTDIDKETIDFVENFDGSLTEPAVLPANLPNLLVNGASGIAVGMSTNIPPHNLGEVCDALAFMLQRWETLDDVTVTDLMRFVKGPDFPTGGLVYRHKDGADDGEDDTLLTAYATGRGKITVRAKCHIEEMGRGKSRIIISELPYQTNKTTLIERIAWLVREGKLEGLADLRDESDRQGLRLVVELQRGVEAPEVLGRLFKLTPLQDTFSIIMLALVNGEPRILSLKQALKVYLDHRLEIVRRRSAYDLNRARERAHILDGLLKAIDQLDRVIAVIRQSPNADAARTN